MFFQCPTNPMLLACSTQMVAFPEPSAVRSTGSPNSHSWRRTLLLVFINGLFVSLPPKTLGRYLTRFLQPPKTVQKNIAGGQSLKPGVDPASTLVHGLPLTKIGTPAGVLGSTLRLQIVFERMNGRVG